MTARPASAFADRRSGDTLVLVSKNMAAAPSAGKVGLILLAITMLVLGMIAYIIVGTNKPADAGWMDTAIRLWAKLHWQDVVAALPHGVTPGLQLALILVVVLFMDRAKRLERLVLSPQGIRYVSPYPGVLKRLVPDWSLSWNQVQAVELGFPGFVHPQRRDSADFVFMWFRGPQEERRILPVRWVNPETWTARDKLRSAFKLPGRSKSEADIRRAVDESEVMRYLSAKQPQIEASWNATPKEIMTSLEKNPHARIVLVLLALLVIYLFADLLLGPESYVDDPDAHASLYIFSAILTAALSGLWLARSTLQQAEKYGLAVLLGVATGFAMIPGALRINQFVGDHPLVTYPCRVIQDKDAIILQPVSPGIPRIRYFANNEYWQKFGKDALYPVQMRKGILGFYQFDSAAILARMESGK